MTASEQTDALTFLFSDIDGSAARWEANQGDLSAAVRRHDELTLAAIKQAGGTLIKTTGDGAHALFPEPGAAVAAALDLRGRLRREAWPASVADSGVCRNPRGVGGVSRAKRGQRSISTMLSRCQPDPLTQTFGRSTSEPLTGQGKSDDYRRSNRPLQRLRFAKRHRGVGWGNEMLDRQEKLK